MAVCGSFNCGTKLDVEDKFGHVGSTVAINVPRCSLGRATYIPLHRVHQFIMNSGEIDDIYYRFNNRFLYCIQQYPPVAHWRRGVSVVRTSRQSTPPYPPNATPSISTLTQLPPRDICWPTGSMRFYRQCFTCLTV